VTTDLAAPPQTRPPHINPRWWCRATWRARQQAIDTHNRHLARIAQLKANVEEARAEHEARYRPATPPTYQPPQKVVGKRKHVDTATLIQTVEAMLEWTNDVEKITHELGMSVSAIEVRLRRANRRDLSRMFAVHRDAERAHRPCPECGKRMYHTSKACKPCSARMQARSAA